jgi:hypothetical protein
MATLSSRDKEVEKWHVALFFVFPILFLILLFLFRNVSGIYPQNISTFDFWIIVLAIYRLIRLFVYDSITTFMRQWLSYGSAFKRSLHHIATCPWCAGIWTSLFVVFFYAFFPQLWLFLLLLAVSAVASFLQLLSNLVGWGAEHKKLETEGLKEDRWQAGR